MKCGIRINLLLALFLIALSAYCQQSLTVTYKSNSPDNLSPASGSVVLDISGGVPPYQVTWCELGTTSITTYEGLKAGIYPTIIKDSLENIVFLQIPVTAKFEWDSTNTMLSLNRLGFGENGWAEFTVSNTSVDEFIGLLYDDDRVDSVIITAGFMIHEGRAKLIVAGDQFELSPSLAMMSIGSKLKIERNNSRFNYYLNGVKIYEAPNEFDLANGSPRMRFSHRGGDLTSYFRSKEFGDRPLFPWVFETPPIVSFGREFLIVLLSTPGV